MKGALSTGGVWEDPFSNVAHTGAHSAAATIWQRAVHASPVATEQTRWWWHESPPEGHSGDDNVRQWCSTRRNPHNVVSFSTTPWH
mmetsp:Transcript_72918/g.169040  ORF Transcript_72918/g.169040 Transcript_72918/m.169040 type:complete len:86 (-) Transcript_72918:1016-1273(-)